MNKSGIYGVLEEYYAYLTSYRAATRLSSITNDMDSRYAMRNILPSLEFCNGICKYYMLFLKQYDPSMYHTLTSDEAFMAVLEEANEARKDIKIRELGDANIILSQAAAYV